MQQSSDIRMIQSYVMTDIPPELAPATLFLRNYCDMFCTSYYEFFYVIIPLIVAIDIPRYVGYKRCE